MNAESEPLLGSSASTSRFRSYRPLSYEEVLDAHNEVTWRRARLGLVLMFWAAMAIFLSLIVSIIMAQTCPNVQLGPVPTVPPVHMSFTPLIS